MTARTLASTCPRANVLATREEILAGCEVFYGVPLAGIGEEELTIAAIGHHDPRRLIAALLAFGRDRGWDAYELGLRHPWHVLVETAEKSEHWHLLYRHADAALCETTALGEDAPPTGWCVCEECSWWALEASETTPGATPTMWWVC